MEYTENLKLRKPLQDEPYDVDNFNQNADKIDSAVRNKVDKPTMLSITIPTEGWEQAAIGQYSYRITIPVPGITEKDIPDGSITLETESVAQDCNLATQCQSGDGTIIFYAQTIPKKEMVYQYHTMKEAD
ncbi:MAG: hypothetical protein ACOCNB_11830 [Acetivibrio ethanolgignens]